MIDNILYYVQLSLTSLADLILPRRCIVCEEKLGLDEKHLCHACNSDMPLTYFWQRKHNPMADKFNDAIQKELEKRWAREGYDHGPHERYVYASALFFFNDDADYKRIPYSIKYDRNLNAGKHFGIRIGHHLSNSEWFQDIDAIIPVPLHWFRRWKRGYNQAEIIASGISQEMKAPIRTDILKRKKYTKTQIRLSITEKSRNVSGAFDVIPGSYEGINHILLVDDVFTTGSTLLACYMALRKTFPPSVRISIATLGFVGHC